MAKVNIQKRGKVYQYQFEIFINAIYVERRS